MEKIDKEFLLNEFKKLNISDEEAFQFYFPEEIKDNRGYINPLRADDDFPSCRFYRHKLSNNFYFRDPAYKNYDLIGFVMEMYNMNYYTACEQIAWDLGIITGERKESQAKKILARTTPTLVKVLRKKYTYQHLDYWKKFSKSITVQELEDNKIYALDAAWLNDHRFYNYKHGDKAFYYHLREGYNYQCYKPDKFYEDLKFVLSPGNKVIGWQKLNKNADYALLGKSYKCWFLLNRYDINNVNLITESHLLNSEEWNFLFSNIKQVYTLFDNDKTGLHMSWLYRKVYGTIPLYFPKTEKKDFSDNLLHFGENYMLDYIEEMKHKLL